MIPQASGLQTDLYELTMAAAYFENRCFESATFELFARRLPVHRSFLISAGLEQALEFLSSVGFSSDEVEFLRQQPAFTNIRREFFDYLRDLHFTGEVWAMPEGTVAFAEEPLVRVTAPIIEAQVVETFLLSMIGFQTMIASKAARVVAAAQGREVIEFGTRRAHGFEAGTLAARAAYIGGCAGTSNVEAGRRFGLPIFGTLAHSFVMAFDREEDAFHAVLKAFPAGTTILVDTYDTMEAVELLAHKFGARIPAVRLDSGDLAQLSKQVRQVLDAHGLSQTKIFASNELNEHRIADLLAAGAPIDGFGVGTDLVTSADAPYLGVVYKLVSYAGRGRIKLSRDKAGRPHAKQVWRQTGHDAHYAGDLIAGADEQTPGDNYRPLLERVMKNGNASEVTMSLDAARHRAKEERQRLPTDGRYPVEFSQQLESDRKKLEDDTRKQRASAG